jgi:hypothetical protein
MGEEDYMSIESEQECDSEVEKEPEVIMSCGLDYSLSDDTGTSFASGEASIELYDENLKILPDMGEVLVIPYREILSVIISDYRIGLFLDSKEELTLSSIGLNYEDLSRNLTKLRNEILIKDMLMNETMVKPGIEAEYEIFGHEGCAVQKGICDVRIYATAVVIIPEGYDPVRVPFCIASEIKAEDYEVLIALEDGSKYRLHAMGKEYDPFKKSLSDTMTNLSSKTQAILKELFPSIGASVIRRAARVMMEGRAAKRSDIESVSPELWSEMEKRLKASGIEEEYEFLKSLSQKEKICIGVKKGLMGELTGEYIWFLTPIYSTDKASPGNAVAMEASSGEGGGKATYLFWMTSREKYGKYSSIEELHKEADAFLKMLNYCMLAINFRREPIYLSDDECMTLPKNMLLKILKGSSFETAVL